MTATVPYVGNLTWIPSQTILLALHGSHAYGMATATSDVDLKGVAIPPRAFFLGFLQQFEQVETQKPFDMVIYDIRKFFRLAADCNPNIIEVLFVDDADVRLILPAGQRLRDHRRDFLSTRAKHTFSGYAMAQLKRIENHRKWLLDPPTAPPVRADFDIPAVPDLPRDQLLAALSMIDKKLSQWELDFQETDRPQRIELQNRIAAWFAELSLGADARWRSAGRLLGFEDNFLDMLDRERRFRSADDEWSRYLGWKKQRNPARAQLEATSGYDTKHAAHLVRLLRMCREILATGDVLVKRPDAAELLAIRNGEWSYERLLGWATDQDAELDALALTSPLPRRPDRAALDALCQELVAQHLGIDP